MTRNDIICMAMDFGLIDIDGHIYLNKDSLEYFVDIASTFYEYGASAEREACAKKMDELCGKLSSKDNLTKSPTNVMYTCHVCNRQ